MSLKRDLALENSSVESSNYSDGYSTKKKRRPNRSDRFHFITNEEVMTMSLPQAPKTTTYSTNWALKNFNDWKKKRNEVYPDTKVPDDLILNEKVADICKWLSFYVTETRSYTGERFPPKSIHQLLSGILRHYRSLNPDIPNFLDKKDHSFKSFHTVLDNLFENLKRGGIGCEIKHSEIISKKDESQLWDTNVLNLSVPKGLLRAVCYYNGKNFCLRGGVEHRNLKLSQFKRCSDHYLYTENVSKNYQGGLAELRIENKIVPIYSTSKDHCHVQI